MPGLIFLKREKFKHIRSMHLQSLRKLCTICAITCLFFHAFISTLPLLKSDTFKDKKPRLVYEKELLASGVNTELDFNNGVKNMSFMTAPLEITPRSSVPIKNNSLSTSKNSILMRDLQIKTKSRYTVKTSQAKENITPMGHHVRHNLSALEHFPSVYARNLDSGTWQKNYGFIYNCSNIKDIKVKRLLGNGITKQVFLGKHKGKFVAIKMVTENVIDVKSCIKRLKSQHYMITETLKHQCYISPNMKLMKEILLMTQLNHIGIQKLLGYCVRSEETTSISLLDHGVIAIYEYGLRFYLSSLRKLPLKQRIETAIHLINLLTYLEYSHLGSLRLSDFKEAHFLLTDGKIKLTDFDDVTSLEVTCKNLHSSSDKFFSMDQEHKNQDEQCKFGCKCSSGMCLNFNAKYNMHQMNKMFFRNLLFIEKPFGHQVLSIGKSLGYLNNRLNSNNITSIELEFFLKKILQSLPS